MPTTKRSWQRAQARGGIALTGVSGLPVLKASTSNEHQPNTRSAGDRPGSPHHGSICRSVGAAVDFAVGQRAAHRRRQLAAAPTRESRIWPVGDTMLAIACASWMPGLEISPPQLPE